MSQTATAVPMSPAPRAMSIITNKSVVRNALSKPRSKRSTKKDFSGNTNNNHNNNNSFASTSKRNSTLQNSNFLVNGNLDYKQPTSRPNTPSQNQNLDPNSNSVLSETFRNKSCEFQKPRAKSDSKSNSTSVSDTSDSLSLESSCSRRAKNPTQESRLSPKKKTLNSQSNSFDVLAPVDSKPISATHSHSNSSTVSPKKKKQTSNSNFSNTNNNATFSSSSRIRRNKKQPTGVTLRVEPDSEQRDLKEILFPDLFSNKNNNAPQRTNVDKQNTFAQNREKDSFAPTQVSSNPAEPVGFCFAGSSFSNTPDPSALPKPIAFGKSSPKSRNSSLHESDDTSSSSSSETDASSPPSPAQDLVKPKSEPVNVVDSPLPSTNSTSIPEQDLPMSQHQSFQNVQQPQYHPMPMSYPVQPYGIVSPFPIPQNTSMAPMATPIIHGGPGPHPGHLIQAPGIPNPYFYGHNNGGYFVPYPVNMGAPMEPNTPNPTNVLQHAPFSIPPTCHQPLSNAHNVPNADLANDLKRMLNVNQ